VCLCSRYSTGGEAAAPWARMLSPERTAPGEVAPERLRKREVDRVRLGLRRLIVRVDLCGLGAAHIGLPVARAILNRRRSTGSRRAGRASEPRASVPPSPAVLDERSGSSTKSDKIRFPSEARACD
jgi:hypothetical protein